MVLVGRLVVAGVVELADKKGVTLDVHEGRREVEFHLGQGAQHLPVGRAGHLFRIQHEVAALAGQIGIPVGARDS